jgi:hypothetical protein
LSPDSSSEHQQNNVRQPEKSSEVAASFLGQLL